MSSLPQDLLERIKQLPPVLALRKRRYERAFASTAVNQFRGVYHSFEQALASAPETKVTGFDVQEFEGYFDKRRNQLFLYDYPFLYWLSRILGSDSSVFDVGGNIVALGTFLGESSVNREVMVKVNDVDTSALQAAIEPVVERLVDLREV